MIYLNSIKNYKFKHSFFLINHSLGLTISNKIQNKNMNNNLSSDSKDAFILMGNKIEDKLILNNNEGEDIVKLNIMINI